MPQGKSSETGRPARKILGQYLVDNKLCTAQDIKEVLNAQAELTCEGNYKPLGRLLVELGKITNQQLTQVLQRQRLVTLSQARIFSTLSKDQLERIAEITEEQNFQPGRVIIRQGDPGDNLCILAKGRVKVFRTSREGHDTVLAQLEPPESIGEMALLTGEPRSASVQAIEETVLLIIHKNSFDAVLEDNPRLFREFSAMLSERIRQSNLRVEDFTDRAAVLESFMAQQAQLSSDELVGTSRAIRVLGEAIDSAAAGDRPVLIEGETGSGRSLAAQLIHKKSAKGEGVLLTLDCNRIPPLSSSVTGQQPNQGPLLDELAQLSALFGHKRGAFSFAPTRRLGHVEVASSGVLVIKNIDRLHINVQGRLAGFLQTGQFFPLGETSGSYSEARVIATTSIDLKTACEAGQFNRELYELLAEQKISVPPLRARKGDIKLLVDYLIAKHSRQLGKNLQGITQSALNMLLGHDWPENVDELQRVIQRAVVLTRAGIVSPEEIFVGIVPFESKGQFNLFSFPVIRAILKNKFFPLILHPLTVAFLGLAILLGLAGPQTADRNLSLILIWGIWWPVLVFSFLLAARVWCALCPMGALAGWASRLANLGLKVPQFIRKYGPYLSVAGFAAIIWMEQATHMSRSPSATAYLLLAILAGALIAGILFERQAWCRYLCPLGAFAGTFASMSALSLRANTNVCRNECKNHECYAGKGDVKGCPMYQGAFSIQTNLHCSLCGNCVKLCPYESPRLNLRVPGNELWTIPQLTLATAAFVPVLMGSVFVRVLENTPVFSAAILFVGSDYLATLTLLIAATAFSFGAILVSSQPAANPGRHDISTRFIWAAYAFIPLAFAGELSYQLSILISYGSQLPAQLGGYLGLNLETLSIQTSPLLMGGIWLALLLPGVGGTLYVAKQLVKRQAQGRRFRFGVAFAVALLYLGLSVYAL